MEIDPWSSAQSTDYEGIIARFGLNRMEGLDLPNPTRLHRRGIVFAHRDLEGVLDAQRKGEPCGVLTGLMPSGMMHLGHSMVIDQVRWFQENGGDVTIAVADLESQATRGVGLKEGRKIALEQYIANYAALGLDPERTQVYFQSSRPIVQGLASNSGGAPTSPNLRPFTASRARPTWPTFRRLWSRPETSFTRRRTISEAYARSWFPWAWTKTRICV